MNEAREGVEAEIAAAIGTAHEELLLGFVVVAEWMASDGERYLTRVAADGTGDSAAMTTWQLRGYLAEGLRWEDYAIVEDDDE